MAKEYDLIFDQGYKVKKYNKVLKLDPNNGKAFYRLAEANFYLKNYEKSN